MEEIEVYKFLLQQTPVVMVLGLVIWWLQKRYIKKDDQLEKLAGDVVQLASHWEDWLRDSDIKGNHDKILQKLDEIKDICKHVR